MIAVYRATIPSLMMQHQCSNELRTRFLLVLPKQLWVRLVSHSGFKFLQINALSYHDDNGILSAEMFRHDYKEWKSQSFSSVGALHQNARAEQAIQTSMHTMARTFLVHASLYWTERGSDDLSIWSFTVKLSLLVYNQLLNVRSGLTPLELITREHSDYKDILRCHVWGCPVFVL